MATSDTPGQTLALSLASHTNAGKTTLARTLLQRDIGEVRDEAHVTQVAERHLLIESAQGDRLELWDTPGFGDSLRLARRLTQSGKALGWFMSEVWDRLSDRSFWLNQRALRQVLEHTDVVLYLVNASEAPEDAGHLDPELQVLQLVGKPVIALLNQLGPPQDAATQAAELSLWRQRLAGHPVVREVLPLDAFARCWVQEGRLFDAVAAALPPAQRPAAQRLTAAWQLRQQTVWQAAMGVLADRLVRAATDEEHFGTTGWSGRLQSLGALIRLPGSEASSPQSQAMLRLAERLDQDIRQGTNRLIALHGLDGEAATQVLARLAEHFARREPVDEGKAAVLGGLVTGALTGLKADILSGGLTLGGGLLAGGVLGALGALGVARGVNKVLGQDKPVVRWSEAVLDELLRSALLAYLAVIHFGRGRGGWTEAEHPSHWQALVDQVMATHLGGRSALWAGRSAARKADPLAGSVGTNRAGGSDTERARLGHEARELLQSMSTDLLAGLYPGAAGPGSATPATARASSAP